MTVGMLMVTTAKSPVELSAWRVLTGLGIGGVLASINAIAAEFSNARRKNLGVAIMAIGYPIGGVLGGQVVQGLLKTGDWRLVFYFGAAVTAVFVPLVFILVPESVHWLAQNQPRRRAEKINRALERMGHSVIAALPLISVEARKPSIADIFSPALCDDADRYARLLLPCHDVLLRAEVDPENHAGYGVCRFLRRGSVDLGESWGRHRWGGVRTVGNAVRHEGTDHRGDDHVHGDGDVLAIARTI